MPPTAEVDGLIRLLDDGHDIGVSIDAVYVGVVLQGAESTGRSLLLAWIEVLFAQDDHMMIQECLFKLLEDLIIELGEINAFDFGTEHPGKRPNIEMLIVAIESVHPSIVTSANSLRQQPV